VITPVARRDRNHAAVIANRFAERGAATRIAFVVLGVGARRFIREGAHEAPTSSAAKRRALQLADWLGVSRRVDFTHSWMSASGVRVGLSRSSREYVIAGD